MEANPPPPLPSMEAGEPPDDAVQQPEQYGLLAAWKDAGEIDPGLPKNTLSMRATRSGLLACSGLVLLAFSLACLVAVRSVLSLANVAVDSTDLDAPILPPSDYILDPAWDFRAEPQRREFTWTVRDAIHNPDGVYRPMILVNNQFPGPLVEVNEGDTIVVHVNNQAVNATSIHWHGIYQNGTPYMDGTVGITQCPIPPGGKFTYEFNVAGQSGTYWWHGHYGLQASDGLHGPLIIHSRRERQLQRIEYSSDRVVMVSDHYHDLSSALLWQYLKPDMENAEPVPNSGLINGRSIVDCDIFPHRNCNNGTLNVGTPTLFMERDLKHRIRFINVGAFAEFQMQVDEHELAVTEVDGTDVEPMYYHRVNLSPAQRYSVIVDTNKSSGGLFWLRGRMVTTCFTDPPETLKPDVYAIVQYTDSGRDNTPGTPTSLDWQDQPEIDCKDMNTSSLRPVEVVAAPAKADAFFYIRSNFEIGAYRLARGFFNASSWRSNVHSPSLLRSIEGITSGNASYASSNPPSTGSTAFVNTMAFDESRELVVQTTGIQTIDIVISNFDDGNHPLHLHGYKYFVLAQGHGYPPLTSPGADITAENLAPLYESLDLSNPLRRDTASVEAYGWILLRVIADNPGAWAFHCHVIWHSEAGLVMQFLTRSDRLANTVVPKDALDLCKAENLEKGSAPEDAAYENLAK